MAIENSIIFGGVNSADFGIYISGEGVFNAPKRDVEMITIPGRNGAFALDNGRFENIEVTYPAFNFEPNDYDTFAQRLSDFRNAICAQRGYQRLEDTFHPDEYRMAAYIGGLDIKPIKYNTASEFDIVFDCKPQRWLKDGETAVTIGEWGETETASGDIVTVENPNGVFAVKSLEVDLEPIQSGSGTPSPDNVRPISGHTDAVVSRSGKNLLDTSTAEIGTAWNGASNSARARLVIPLVVGQTYTLKANGTSTLDAWYGIETNTIPPTSAGAVLSNPYTFTATTRYLSLGFNKMAIASSDIEALKLQLELGSTATTYEPYQGTTYTTALGRTVYGGTLDVTSGVLTVDREIVDLGDKTWTMISVSQGTMFRTTQSGIKQVSSTSEVINAICDRYRPVAQTSRAEGTLSTGVGSGGNNIDIIDSTYSTAAAFKTAMSGAQLVYELATPQTYQLTAQQIDLLTGDNNIWSDSGDITLEYGQNPSVLFNPTLFESGPLLDVYGYGSISFNDYTIEITPQFYGEVDILGSKSGFTYSLRTDLYNSGDTIYLTAKKRLGVQITDPSKSFDDYDEWTMTDSGSGTTAYTARTPSYIEMETNFVDVAIDSSQSSQTITNTFSGTISINHVAYSLSAVFTATYSKGNGTITLDAGSTTGAGFPNNKRTNTMGWVSIIANSTKSMLGDPTYIDCDIGEAYLLSDGMPVSLNQYIDLGSELPKLASGSNTITFDNTITELKVQPRWWKV